MSVKEDNMESDDGNNESNGSGEVTALHDLIAGGIAGSASVVIGHPFDTIKVRLQTSAPGSSTSTSTSGKGGFLSLFKGMAAPLSTAAVVNAIIFATYGSSIRLWEDVFESGRHDDETHGMISGEGAVFIEHDHHGLAESSSSIQQRQGEVEHQQSLQEIMADKLPENQTTKTENNNSTLQRFKIFTCGCLAGTIQAFVICPMEHIKCRLQVQSSSIAQVVATNAGPAIASTQQQLYKGPVDVCTSIIKKHGITGLYRGMGVTLWRETPAFGLYFATYDTIKDRVTNFLEEKDEKHPIPSHAHAWAASALGGGISGALTWAVIYPFDVIKTRIQTSPLEKHLRRGMWTVGRDIVEGHGWRYMFRGLGVTLARAFPVNAIIFPVYELVLVQLGDAD